MTKHANIKIYGRVQGVLFRDAARRRARKLNLTGFVKNDDDGSVYIEAEGDEEKLGAFIAWCREGPSFAEVEKVDVALGDELKRFSDFVIAY